MTKEMRRVAATVLAAASLLLMAVSASALTVLDTSKKAVPPNSFVTKVKVAQSQFKAGKWLAVPFSPATAITADKLRQLTLGELNTLEESMFPATTKWFDNNGVSRYGKLSTKALSSENAKAVERIRTERAKAEAMMPKVKNNASLDLNGDGKKKRKSAMVSRATTFSSKSARRRTRNSVTKWRTFTRWISTASKKRSSSTF